jgi:hypothetical protein
VKRAVVLVLAVIGAVVAFIALVPEVDTTPWWRSRDPAIAALQDLQNARQDSIRALRAARERLLALETVRRAPRATGPLTFQASTNIPAATRSAFENRIREEVAAFGDTLRHAMRVQVVSDSATDIAYAQVVVLPREASEPCSIVILIGGVAQGRTVLPVPKSRLLGTCEFYAAFGSPGSGMREWLHETHGAMASTSQFDTTQAPPRRRLTSTIVFREPSLAACVVGDDASCLKAWNGNSWERRLSDANPIFPEAIKGTVRQRGGLGLSGRLAGLRVAMTDVRFREVWRSDKSPLEAYELVEGRSLAQFVRDQLLLEVEPHVPGPLQAGLPLALGVVLAAATAIVTIRFTKRTRS